jgi:hypothetical protein
VRQLCGGGRFGSTSSAAVSAFVFNGLARTVAAPPRPLPSASLATVRRAGAVKPLLVASWTSTSAVGRISPIIRAVSHHGP